MQERLKAYASGVEMSLSLIATMALDVQPNKETICGK